jgi:dynein heavy chain
MQQQQPPIMEDVEFQDIVVPTVDTVRHSSLLDTLLRHGEHVLFTGPTGTAKT